MFDFMILLINMGSYALYGLYLFIFIISLVMRRWLNGAWRVFALFRRDAKIEIHEDELRLGSHYGSNYFNLKCDRLSAKFVIRGHMLGGVDFSIADMFLLFIGLILPLYPKKFIDVSPVLLGNGRVKSNSIEADIRYVLYSIERMAYEVSSGVGEGIDQLYGDLRWKLPFWRLLLSSSGIMKDGMLSSAVRVWFLKASFLSSTFDSVRVGRYLYFIYSFATAGIPLFFMWYIISGCENRCEILQYFVFTPVILGGLLGSLSFYLLSTEISSSRVLLVSSFSRLYDFLIAIFFAMSLFVFRDSGNSYFDQNTIFLLYLIVFIVLQRLNIHRMYEIAQSRLKL